MTKRSTFLIAAFALVASLAFTTPSRAGNTYIITSDSLSNSLISGPASGSFTAYAATNLPQTYTISPDVPNANIGHYTATTTSSTPVSVTGDLTYLLGITYGARTGTLTIDVKFNSYMSASSSLVAPSSASITGATGVGVDFKSVVVSGVSRPGSSNTNNILVGLAVPEPASMSLLGIGVAGLLSFRRIFRRKAAV